MKRPAWWALAAIGCLAAVLSAVSHVVAAEVEPTDAGRVLIVDGRDPDRALERGTSTSEFRVLLPSGATCPGDSMHDQWRLQSFMVPAGVDLGTLRYGGIGPEGVDHYALFTADAAQHSYNNELLPPSPSGGVEVNLPALPVFSFEAVSGVPLSEGDYVIGVACTYFGATARYWDTPIVVTGSSAGRSTDFRWRLASAPVSSTGADSSPLWVGMAATLLVVLAVAVALQRRRHHLPPEPAPRQPLRPKEHS